MDDDIRATADMLDSEGVDRDTIKAMIDEMLDSREKKQEEAHQAELDREAQRKEQREASERYFQSVSKGY